MGRKKIAVIGGGSWGTALAFLLGNKGFEIHLWVYEPELVDIINTKRENTFYLPEVRLPETISASNSFADVLAGVDTVVWVTPSHTVRKTLGQAVDYLTPNMLFVGASKGIENDTLLRVSEIVDQIVPESLQLRYVTLSGPTFAAEVARFQPTTAVVAGKDHKATAEAQNIFNTALFRVYANNDHIGVELGGALKNVIAIAAGISAGLELGSNSRAALITRGLWEITRLGHAMGANTLTFLGLAGMGDLVLTCDGTQSRNFKVGLRIGQGESLTEIQNSMRMVAEGVKTTVSVRALAKKYGVEMPITEQIYQVLHHNKPPKLALKELMTRSLKSEHQIDYPDNE